MTEPTSEYEIKQRLRLLPEWVDYINSQDTDKILNATMEIRKLLSIPLNPPIIEVIETGVVPKLIKLLSMDDNPSIQFEASWALTNIASGTEEQTKVIIDYGAIKPFVRLINSPNINVKEQAIWALGNLAGSNFSDRDKVLESGALKLIVEMLNKMGYDDSSSKLIESTTVWTISNLCRAKPQPSFDKISISIPALAKFIHSKSDETLIDTCWALSYLSNGDNERVQAVIDSGICGRLVELLKHPNNAIQVPALRTIGNIMTGNDYQTQVILNLEVLPHLFELLKSPKQTLRKEALWTLSNTMAGNRNQIQQVLDYVFIPFVLNAMEKEENDLKKESAWVISNALSGGSNEQIKYIINQGCIKPLCDLLTIDDPKILTVALEAIEKILIFGNLIKMTDDQLNFNPYLKIFKQVDGVSKIKNIQHREDIDLYTLVTSIQDLLQDVDGVDSILLSQKLSIN